MIRLKFIKTIRFYSVNKAIKKDIKYTNTINLPKTKYPAHLTPVKRGAIESSIVDSIPLCYEHQERHNSEPAFVLHDGPPYANGDLHIGHAVNKILKDITIRHRVVRGQKVHYVPGWDCHGLPIELKALVEVESNNNTDPVVIRKKSRQFAMDAIAQQKSDFRSWGVLANWNESNKLYFTFNKEFIKSQLELFMDLYGRGLIYRDLKPVHWSPSSKTALAEAELEYDANFVSPAIYVRLKLNEVATSITKPDKGHVYVVIWTTTPWTLPSNQAVCFSSNLEYVLVKLKFPHQTNYDHENYYIMAKTLLSEFEKNTNIQCDVVQSVPTSVLKTCTYQHPIFTEESLPFIDATHVQATKGTGLVHTAPAHGPDDFLVFLNNKTPIKSLVTDEGLYNNYAPDFLRGKSVLDEGNNMVIQYLDNNVLAKNNFVHSYPIDWRTKKPIIIRASEQWFINTAALKNRALDEIEKVGLYPQINATASRNALRSQIIKRPYWCISRQRAWGVPIPVFYDNNTGKNVTSKQIVKHICDLLNKEGNIDFWWSRSVEDILPSKLLEEFALAPSDVSKGMDIFDIWFDSGTTWHQVLGDIQTADLNLEGYDQFTGWFQSSLLTSVAARDRAPYKALFVHGFAVDENGCKMSKSMGNVISPQHITKTYGTDVLRWWVAAHGTQHTKIVVSDNLLQQSAASLAKFRGILRYLKGALINQRIERNPQHLKNYLDRYLLSTLVTFDQEVFSLYDAHEYNRVVACVQNYITNQISSIYIHSIKDRLYCGSAEEIEHIRCTLENCYHILCKVLWPIVPFLVEESWTYYDDSTKFYQNDFQTDAFWKNAQVECAITKALEVKHLINQQTSCKNSWLLAVEINCCNEEKLRTLQQLHPTLNRAINDSELCELLQVQSVCLNDTLAPSTSASTYEIFIDEKDFNLCPRCRRFAIDNNDVCQRCDEVIKTPPK